MSQESYLKTKCYHLTLVTYLENFVDIINDNLDCIKKWAYCTHDKDICNTGELKKSHTHVILSFYSVQTLNKYSKLFNTTEIKPLERNETYYMFDYLIHNTDNARRDNKYQYSTLERFTNDYDYFKKSTKNGGKVNVLEMLDDVQSLSPRQFVGKYGLNALYNYQKIKDFSFYCDNYEKSVDIDKCLC